MNVSKNSKSFLTLVCVLPAIILGRVSAVHACTSGYGLEGSLAINDCDPKVAKCERSLDVLYEYADGIKSNNDEEISVTMVSSPWRLYGKGKRILSLKTIAQDIRDNKRFSKVKRAFIYGSWTGHKAEGRSQSIADELSGLLNGFHVEGIDGFLWIKKNGEFYATKQAYTIGGSYPYYIYPDDDLMVDLPYGSFIQVEDHFIKEKDGQGLRYAAVGWDVFVLCPEKALALFEMAAGFSDDISAYNAAVMLLERGQDGDKARAIELLEQAAARGDAESISLLNEVRAKK